MSTLEAKAISVRRTGHWILSDASMTLVPGEVLAIAGPNGSGKSTLLRALAGIWNVDQGSVLLDGKPIEEYSRKALARRVAFVPQEQRTEFAFTVEQFVAMGRYPHRGRFSAESAQDRQVVSHALHRCDIVALRNRAVNTLSGGEHQRALIARSLAVEPQYVLLDEPTASLDVEHTLQVLDICRTLAGDGHAVALATHDLNLVARYADKVLLLQEGRLAHSGPLQEVLTSQNIEATFGVRAELLSSQQGQPVYVFHSRE
jgi:cobalamin transport system ATP-binding protein